MSQVDPKEYHVEEEGTAKEMFVCNVCNQKFKKVGGVKSHITKIHNKKAPEVVVEKPAEEIDTITEKDLAGLARWDRPRSEPVVIETETEVDTLAEDADVADEEAGQEGDIGQAIERIKKLEEELSVKEELIKKMETDLETAKDNAAVATAKVESLEADNAAKKVEVKKFQRICLNQMDGQRFILCTLFFNFL